MENNEGFQLDYALLRGILATLKTVYPGRMRMSSIPCLVAYGIERAEEPLMYLLEHGMIDMPVQRPLGGRFAFGKITLTAKGLDFLQPDGGLSALAAPVIRISPDSLVAIIDEALAARGISEEERSAVKKSLGIAGEEGIRAVVGRLVEAGASHAPDILRLFGLL